MHAPFARPVSLTTLLLIAATMLAACGNDDQPAERDDARPATDSVSQPDASTGEAAQASPIVLAEGIGGVRIGDSSDDVQGAKGKPASSEDSTNEANIQPETTLTYADPQLRVILGGNGEVRQIETEDDAYRTAEGIGVGTNVDHLRSAYPDIRCHDEAPQVCGLGSPGGGEVTTDFFVEDDVVTRVVVARLEH